MNARLTELLALESSTEAVRLPWVSYGFSIIGPSEAEVHREHIIASN